eukprot:5293435-Pleurochrysis_carterae.AAC.4
MPPLHPTGKGKGGPDATPSPARGIFQPRLSALSRLPVSPLRLQNLRHRGWWVRRTSGLRPRS